MSRFDGSRFLRLLGNDLLQQWKKIWIATLALAGLALVAYLSNIDPRGIERPAIYLALFPIALLVGGLVFTSTIFADLHHPLQRFHYLTLPCSNLERFLSRYLLSAPLYYLYVLIVYAVFDWLAAHVAQAFFGTSAAPFSPFDPWILDMTLGYFAWHALMFAGAIYFRSHAAIKTLLSTVIVALGLVVFAGAAVRLFYWSYFPTLLSWKTTGPLPFLVMAPQVRYVVGFVLAAWALFVAYQCLREHEVQGGL